MSSVSTSHTPRSTPMPTKPSSRPRPCCRVARSSGISTATKTATHSGVVALSRPARIDVTRVWAKAMSVNGTAVMIAATTTRSLSSDRCRRIGRRIATSTTTSVSAPSEIRPKATAIGLNERSASSLNMKLQPQTRTRAR